MDGIKYAQLCEKSYSAPTIRYKNEQIYQAELDGETVYAIAGSNDLADWRQNLSAWRWVHQRRIPGTRHKATSGYVQAALNVVERIESGIGKRQTVRFTGHSKGGPVAAIVSILLQAQGYKINAPVTFAAPKFSTQDGSGTIWVGMLRYVAEGDVVPELPSDSFFGWRKWQHYGRQIDIGRPVNDYPGIIRDGLKAHLIANYLEALA